MWKCGACVWLLCACLASGAADQSVTNLTACTDALMDLIAGVTDLQPWALRMVESSAWLPAGLLAGQTVYLGRYDECLSVSAPSPLSRRPAPPTRYCLASLCVGRPGPDGLVHCPDRKENAVVQLINLATTLKGGGAGPGSAALRFGLCSPAACSGRQLQQLAQPWLRPLASHLSLQLADSACWGPDDPPRAQLRPSDWAAAGALATLLAAAAAVCTYRRLRRGREPAPPSPPPPPPARPSPSLPVLHGLRVIAMVQVVICHRFSHQVYALNINPLAMIEAVDSKKALVVKVFMYSVDTFFMLSGLLVTYIYLNRAREGKPTPLTSFYLHRIIRLWPAMLAALLVSRLLPLLEAGPMWWEQTKCEFSWAEQLLFLSNIREQAQCVGYLWYLAADTQMYVVSPLALLALRRRPRAALKALAAMAAVGVVLRFCLAYWGELPLVFPSVRTGIERWAMSMHLLYKPSYTRYSAFAVGMTVGYALHKLKRGRNPPVLSQAAVQGLRAACCLLLAAVLGPLHLLSVSSRPRRPLAESLYVAAGHTAWALAMAAFVLLAAVGRGGPLARWLSDPRWRPLSRLSYAIYLVHMPVVQADLASQRMPLHFGPVEVFLRGLGNFAMSVPCAFLLTKLCDEPMQQLESLLLPRPGDVKEQEKSGKLPLGDKEKDEAYRRML